MTQYVIACSTPWFSRVEKSVDFLHHRFVYLERKEDLTLARLREINPRYIFFPHWSWRVPAEIVKDYECVCFHSTPLPYGRGGSPIQNMIQRGHADTTLTALRMTEGLDDGPIYLQRALSLAGSGNEIFTRIAELAHEMILAIIDTAPQPTPQFGEPTVFKRRTPEQSELPRSGSPSQMYDHIRMLDAEGYPRGFLHHGDFVLEFDHASLQGEEIHARVVIRKRSQS